jgi:hypothetical protein
MSDGIELDQSRFASAQVSPKKFTTIGVAALLTTTQHICVKPV